MKTFQVPLRTIDYHPSQSYNVSDMKLFWVLAGILCVAVFIFVVVITILVVRAQGFVYGRVAYLVPFIPLMIIGLLSLAGSVLIFWKKILQSLPPRN